jgi:DNA invertase Pin-like site-specific DNA recombinase
MNQRNSMVRFAEERQAAHIVFFVDNDMSGSKVRRAKAAWWICLAAMKEQRPRYLVGVKSDRLGRRLTDIEGLDDLTRSTGTKVFTLAESDLFANPAWPFIAAMAKAEAMNTSFRIRQAQAVRKSKGLDTGGGNRPYGYAADRLTIVPEEAAIIQELARRIIAGESGHSLAAAMNERGVPTPGGGSGRWVARTIRRMMASSRYAAIRREDASKPGEFRNKRFKEVGAAAWPAILDRETWEQVQAVLAATTTKPGRPYLSLLGGIARCGYCEMPITAANVGTGRKIYKCSKQAGGCGNFARTRGVIDEYVQRHALEQLGEQVSDNEGAELDAENDRIADELVRADLRLSELREAYANGDIEAGDFYPTLATLQKRIKTLDAAYRRTNDELRILRSDKTAAERWDTMTTDERRAFLRDHLATVLLYRTPSRGLQARVIKEGEVVLVPKNHRKRKPKPPADARQAA